MTNAIILPNYSISTGKQMPYVPTLWSVWLLSFFHTWFPENKLM